LRTYAHCVKIFRSPSFLDDDDASIFAELPDDEEDLGLDDDMSGDDNMSGAKSTAA
jgi:hypothetical protein